MRRKILGVILTVLGILGFLVINSAIYRIEIDDSIGYIMGLIGTVLIGLVALGMFFYNRIEPSPSMPKWEKKRKKRLGLVI